MMQVRKLA